MADIKAWRQKTKAGIKAAKAELLKWFAGTLVAQGALVAALLKLL